MRSRLAYDRLRVGQQKLIANAIDEWREANGPAPLINPLMTTFTLAVLLLTGLLATREIGRRTYLTHELERQVRERTVELEELSEQLMRVSDARSPRCRASCTTSWAACWRR